MKKILFYIFIAIGLLFLIFYSYKYINNIFLGDIVTKSEIKNIQLIKSDEFDEFNDFLYESGFWDTNGSSTETGRGRITPSKLTITITNSAQNGGFLKKSLNDINFYSSYRFETKDNKVNLILHIDPNICKLPDCDIEDVTNKQILRAIYGITRTDNTPTTGEDYSNLYQKYNKRYFSLDSRISNKIYNFISDFKLVSTVYAGCDWFCAAESCSGYPILCSYGPSGFTDASSGTDCSASCPSGYQAQNVSCSGCAATPAPGGGGAYQYPTCGGNLHISCASPAVYSNMCTQRGSCGSLFPSVFTTTDCDGPDSIKGSCQTNCYCCAPGSDYSCTPYSAGTYNNNTETANSNFTGSCSAGDTLISNTLISTRVVSQYTCWTDDETGEEVCGRRNVTLYTFRSTCNNIELSCSCVAYCTASSPSAPQQTSPANGTTIATTTPNLTWNITNFNWGTSCTTTNRTFQIYAGPVGSTMALVGSVNSTTGTVPFTGTAGVTYQWKVRASNGQGFTDSETWTFTINPGPWWQAKDADLTTNNGISSDVPTGQLFNTIGLGGFPGVVTYGTTFNLTGTTKISTTSWNSNTTTIQPRLFNYSYFDNLIPESVRNNMTIATDDSLRNSTGYKITGSEYEWFKSDGSLTIASDINFGTRKVILFIENGGLGINGKVNLNDGLGFFGAFVEGNIVVDPAVTGTPSIEGVYLTDLGFSSGISTLPLHIRGSIVSHGGITLSRDLANNSNPAELFEFAPDQVLLFPDNLRYKRTKWAEIAP